MFDSFDHIVRLDWVSAGRTRNHLLKDPLIDWLKLFGKQKGFTPDNELPGYDERTDFGPFIMTQGQRFEERLCEVLAQDIDIVTLERQWRRSVEDQAADTLEVLKTAPEAVAQGCVADPVNGTYGYPDLLVRSDVVARMWPEDLCHTDAKIPAPALGLDVHYVVVDIKFSSLSLKTDGTLGNSGSAPAYKGQVFIYNRALAAMQGFEPAHAFIMGRSWSQGWGANKQRGTNAIERLGPVPMREVPKKGPTLAEQVGEAVDWMRRLKRDGASWEAMPTASVPELRPNMGNTADGPWHAAKKTIAQATGELTLLWQVGPAKRDATLDAGITRWQDVPTAADVGVTGAKTGPVLDAVLAVNQSAQAPAVQPARIDAAIESWGQTPPLEFYVDFETVSDLADDFAALPERGGQPLIFMIGCGHVENGRFLFREFTVDALDQDQEASIIEAWLEHMADVTGRLAPGAEPKVIHWSHAEVSMLESAYNSAVARHAHKQWPRVNWFDFLKQVIKAEPVVVRGALGFGLKAIAKALHGEGLIETVWGDGPTDGLGAMVGAWRAAEAAAAQNRRVSEMDLVREIAAYNEVDTRVMWEIVSYLRHNHTAHSDKTLVRAA